MDRHTLNKGYILAELCVCVLALSTLAMIVTPVHLFEDDGRHTFASQYLLKQSEAIASCQAREFTGPDGTYVHFNEKGNISRAGTVIFANGKKIVMELGGGRLVFY